MSDIFEAAEAKMQKILDGAMLESDPEGDHIDADTLLVALLRDAGNGEADTFIGLYDQVLKWYA